MKSNLFKKALLPIAVMSLGLLQIAYGQDQTNDPVWDAVQSTNSSVLSQAAMAGQANMLEALSVAQSISTPQLIPQNGGALYQSTTFAARLAYDITTPGAVDVETSSGQHICASDQIMRAI